jgi:hypothetical protein
MMPVIESIEVAVVKGLLSPLTHPAALYRPVVRTARRSVRACAAPGSTRKAAYEPAYLPFNIKAMETFRFFQSPSESYLRLVFQTNAV